jgi:hypothetical protein
VHQAGLKAVESRELTKERIVDDTVLYITYCSNLPQALLFNSNVPAMATSKLQNIPK